MSSFNALLYGSKTMKDLEIHPHPLWQAYLDLGRFRNALILDEQQRRPTKGLAQFIALFGLHGYDGREE